MKINYGQLSRSRALVRRAAPNHLWPTAALYAALATTVTLLASTPGRYVADNRFEQYRAPWRSLSHMFTVWDGSRGLGGPREDVWLGSTLPVALLRTVGLSTATSARVFHAVLLVVVGLGVVAVMRVFRPRIAAEHVLAGLLVMFGPFSATFLVPSNLYLMFALSPWLLLATIRGIPSRGWRWPAAFALIVFVAGNADVPGLLYVAVMLVPTAIYLVLVERAARWRDVAAWAARTVSLSVAVSAWALVKTYYAAEPLDARLADTELPSASATSSSWSESLRGLGNWLSYFRERGAVAKPQTNIYFEQPLVIALTFVPAILALVALWRSPMRHRVLFGAIAVVGVTAMVGGFGVPNASPFGARILWLFSNVTSLASFRNTYKAAAGLVIGTAVLASIAAVSLYRVARLRSGRRAGAVLLAGVATAAALAAPFLTASAYNRDEQFRGVPEYWQDAIDYLNDGGSGRALIVPAISQARYRWGYVGDDIFDALMTRPHPTGTGWMLSTRPGHNALEQITLSAQEPQYRPGVVAAMAARLGIAEIVVRNDLDWQDLGIARPLQFEALRNDPDLELVRTFGRRGQNVAGRLDTSADAAYERTLPPVEVYRVRRPTDIVTVTAGANASSRSSDTVIVAGDAGGWPAVLRHDLAGAGTALAASAAMSDDELVHELEGGAPVVMTDSARRRVRLLLHHEPALSPTLAPDQELDRPPRPVYPETDGSESTAWTRDATEVSGSYIALGGFRNDRRPALAFDGDAATAWAVPWSGLGTGPRMTVQFREPERLGRIDLRSMLTPTGRPTVTGVTLIFDDGTEQGVEFDRSGRARVDLGGRTTDSLTFLVDDIGVFGAEVGIAEITVDGLDLAEYVKLPADLSNRVDPRVASLLRDTPVSYAFRRVSQPVSAVRFSPPSTAYDEEHTMRRRFDALRDAALEVVGTATLLTTTSDRLVADLLDQPVSATSNRAVNSQFDGAPALAIDGDLTTSWVGGSQPGATLSVTFPRQEVRTVRVRQPTSIATAEIEYLAARVGDVEVRAKFGPSKCATWPVARCSAAIDIAFPPGTSGDRLDLEVRSVETFGAVFREEVRIADVRIVGGPSLDLDAPLTDTCVDVGIRLAGDAGEREPDRVPVRVRGTARDLLDGALLPFVGCDPVAMSQGVQHLVTLPGTVVDDVVLVPDDWPDVEATRSEPIGTAWSKQSDDRFSITVDEATATSPEPITVTLRTSYDDQWTLRVAGRTIEAVERDNGNSWTFVANGDTTWTIDYAPSTILRRAIVVSLVSVALCLVLAARRRPPPVDLSLDATDDRLTSSERADTLAVIAATAIGVALAGPWTLAIGAVTLVALRRIPGWRAHAGLAAPVLLSIAAVWSALVDPWAPVTLRFAADRWEASALGALAVAFTFQTVALAAVAARRPEGLHPGLSGQAGSDPA